MDNMKQWTGKVWGKLMETPHEEKMVIRMSLILKENGGPRMNE